MLDLSKPSLHQIVLADANTGIALVVGWDESNRCVTAQLAGGERLGMYFVRNDKDVPRVAIAAAKAFKKAASPHAAGAYPEAVVSRALCRVREQFAMA